MNVQWVKCNTGTWCRFLDLDPKSVREEGIYIIWCENENIMRVVYVGQGNVAQRITEHRANRDITQYATIGNLCITWAAVSSQHARDGIERYLAVTCNPLVGDKYPEVTPIEVNLPWN